MDWTMSAQADGELGLGEWPGAEDGGVPIGSSVVWLGLRLGLGLKRKLVSQLRFSTSSLVA